MQPHVVGMKHTHAPTRTQTPKFSCIRKPSWLLYDKTILTHRKLPVLSMSGSRRWSSVSYGTLWNEAPRQSGSDLGSGLSANGMFGSCMIYIACSEHWESFSSAININHGTCTRPLQWVWAAREGVGLGDTFHTDWCLHTVYDGLLFRLQNTEAQTGVFIAKTKQWSTF